MRTTLLFIILLTGCMHMTSISHPILHRKCSQECKERYARNDRPQNISCPKSPSFEVESDRQIKKNETFNLTCTYPNETGSDNNAIGVCCTDGQWCTNGNYPLPDTEFPYDNIKSRIPDGVGGYVVTQTLRVTNLERNNISLSCCVRTANGSCVQMKSFYFQILDTPSDDIDPPGGGTAENYSNTTEIEIQDTKSDPNLNAAQQVSTTLVLNFIILSIICIIRL